MARLLTNLQGEDAVDDAARQGFDFPTSTSEDLQKALEALLQESEDEVETEELLYDWDDNLQEEVVVESSII